MLGACFALGYEWRAYEAWIKPDGTFRAPRLSLLMLDDDGAKPELLMKDGAYKGRNSLDLMQQSADWIEERIFAAIRRAGFDPDESRSIGDLLSMQSSDGGT